MSKIIQKQKKLLLSGSEKQLKIEKIMFNPKFLRFALDKRGISNKDLADKLGVTIRQVGNYLDGTSEPDINKLAIIFRLPVHFFQQDAELPTISEHAISFRSKSRTTQKLQKQAINHAITGFWFNDWLENEFELKIADLPNYSNLSPEEAAQTLRYDWGLGDKPIGSMLNLLESKGIRIFSLSLATLDLDALCTWYNNRPFIFLNHQKSAERSRFDAAHELGHLIRDQYSMKNCDKERSNIEKEANEFASAFLMPKAALLAYRHIRPTLENLMKIKKIFGVSLVALAYRMHQLGFISDWIYKRSISIEITKQGYRVHEPKPMPFEISMTLTQILNSLKEEKISITDIAKQINVSTNDIVDLVFHLVEPKYVKYQKLYLVK